MEETLTNIVKSKIAEFKVRLVSIIGNDNVAIRVELRDLRTNKQLVFHVGCIKGLYKTTYYVIVPRARSKSNKFVLYDDQRTLKVGLSRVLRLL